MGVLRSGILGQIRGKVAGVVGGQWKDKNYIREYVKPANPNTAAQQVQRGKFGRCVAFAQPLVGQVFNVYSDPFLKSMSGFNDFIKRNVAQFTDPPSYGAVEITQGKLYYARIVAINADATGNLVEVNWTVSLGSNGAADDKVFCIAYNVTSGRWGFADSTPDRDEGATGVSISLPQSTGDVIQVYSIAAAYSGTSLVMVSNSDNGQATSA